MVAVYRAPMRSRRDDIDCGATIERAIATGVVGFGDDRPDRVDRRVARFADAADGSFVWTREAPGVYRLGRVDGPYRFDPAGAGVDLVHVRPCSWSRPIPEHRVPAAVLATYARGGRNFQHTHGATVGAESATLWDEYAQM